MSNLAQQPIELNGWMEEPEPELDYVELSIDDGSSQDNMPPNHTQNQSDDDDWEIPLERIVMYPNDFHRCGSQGDVYSGKLSNSPVAVKRVRDSALANIRHLKDLNHENIIKFRGVSQDPRRNYYYIVMEFCNNGTLAQKLHDAHPILSPSNLCDFALQIASGMKYLHSNNIIHRDLKPSNILLTRNNELKISDFGTHKVFNNQVFSTSQTGTYAYMAPEVIRGESHSFPIDVWSFGVVLWEMFIGLIPYSGMDSSAVVWAVGNNSFHLPIPTSFPSGLSYLLKKCWYPKPSDRTTFKEIWPALNYGNPELKKISKERWPPTQAGWKREARDELQKHLLQFTDDPNEDELYTQKRKAFEEALEQAQKLRNRNNHLHLKLQECSMLVLRERREIEMREETVSRREQALAEAESENANRVNELNRLKETLSRIKAELDRRGIDIDHLF